jgi:hypothetical protein
MTNDGEQSSLSIQTVDSAGKAPKRRISTPAAAQGAYYNARTMERQRDARYGDIRGIFDGFPPTPPARMEEMGMGDMPNINLKQFQSKIDQYVDTWRRVTTAGKVWYEVKAKHDDPREAQRRSSYLTICFNRAIWRWDSTDFRHTSGYVLRCAARDTQLGLFGLGISHFPDSIDFRWQMRPTRKVLVPFGTQITMENCPVVFIEDDTISVTQLYSMKDKPGWNKEAVLYALYLRTNQQNQPSLGRAFTFSEWENWLRNNESWLWYTEFNPVRVINCYVREFSEDANDYEITHTIFMDTQATGGGTLNDTDGASKDAKKTGWLFEKEKAAKRWSEVLCIFADNAGPEMAWHGVKGHGDLIYDLCHFNNLMFNRTATSAIVSNMPIFVGADESQRQRINQITFSFGAILFPDLGQMQQMRIANDVKSAADVFMLGAQSLDQISRTTPANQAVGPEKTATQENYERMAQTELSSLQIANYQATGGDALGSEMYRRIAQPASKYPKAHPGGNVAAKFREEAKEFGIPESELLDVESVVATRQGGTGSMAVDMMKWKEALAIATPGGGQLTCRKGIAMALFPPDVADTIVEEMSPPPDEEDVTIGLENLNIQSGQVPVAFGFQPHEKHLRQPSQNDHLTILSGLEQVVNGFLKTGVEPQQLQDAVKLHNAFDAGIGHCEQHTAFMEEMPRSGARPSIYEGFLKEIRPVLNGMRQISRAFAETISRAQEQAAQLPANQDPKMAETLAKIDRDDMLAAADIERKNAAADAKLGNLAVTQEARTQTKMADADLNMGLKAQQSAFDLQTQRTQAIQELEEKAGQAQVDLALHAAKSQQELQAQKEKQATQNEQNRTTK